MHDLTFNFQDLIVNSPLLLLHIALLISYENMVLERDNICLIKFLITSGSKGLHILCIANFLLHAKFSTN